MRLSKILAVLVARAAGTAAPARPGRGALDAMPDRAVRDGAASPDIDLPGEALPPVALADCNLRPTDRVAPVRRTLDLRSDEGALPTHVAITGWGRSATGRDAFGRFVCDPPEGIP